MRPSDLRLFLLSVVVITHGPALAAEPAKSEEPGKSVLDFKVQNIEGREVDLGTYRGQVLLIVNVASECGLTPQYQELEALYRKYKERGLRILAFPANDFGAQEPGTNKEIRAFCTSKYDVTFDLFSKVSVKGDQQCDLYRYLTDPQRNAPFGGEIRWNFQKFLIDREGRVISRFDPQEKPLSNKIIEAVESALKTAAPPSLPKAPHHPG